MKAKERARQGKRYAFKVDECKYFTECDYHMAKMREMIYHALHIFVSPCRQEGKQTY